MALADDCADVNAVDFTYPFLKGIDPANPPAHITIPDKYLDAMANMERQYWEIKASHYNVLIFFKKGKFYELYDHDAVIANREFGLKMVFDTSNRGKMRLAGVPEQSLSEWARLFVFRGYKVGRVEQMVKGAEDDSPSGGGARAKIVPRELVEVLTPGTLTDPAMLSDHTEVFLLALAPQAGYGVVDAFAVDLSRRVVYWCPCGTAEAVRRYREGAAGRETVAGGEAGKGEVPGMWVEVAMRCVTALLQQLHPREVVMPVVSGTSKADVVCSDYLSRWVQADGFVIEPVLMSSTRSSASSPSLLRECSPAPSARDTLSEYLRLLKLERQLPLLDEAFSYEAHMLSSSSTAPTLQGVREEEEEGRAATATSLLRKAGGLLEWERKFGNGLVLDSATVGNLEIVANLLDGSERHSLHQCLNQCITNGGKRLFRAWLLRPSASARVIELRQDAVRFLLRCGLANGNELWGSSGSACRAGGSAPSPPCTPDAALADLAAPRDPLSPPSTGSVSGVKRSRQEAAALSPSSSPSAASPSTPPGRGSSGNAHFLSRFANMLSVDYERSLSRLAEIKGDDQHQTISYVDPLVKYHKNLGVILGGVQAFSEMVEWASQFHAMCRRHCYAWANQPPSTTTTAPHGSPPAQTVAIPPLLEELLLSVEAAAESVTAMEMLFDRRAAAESGLLIPAPGTSAAYDSAVAKLSSIEEALHAYRRGAQERVFGGAPVSFVDLGKDLFLLEVATSSAPKMTPAGMVERARSGKSVKYVVDALSDLVEAHKEATAAKSASLLTVLQSVAANMCQHCPSLYTATSALSYLDCLINLARLTNRFPHMCFPRVVLERGGKERPQESFITATDLIHPLLAMAARSGGGDGCAPVPNTVSLDSAHGRLLVLTGPNMAGKSTLMRTVAANVIMAQLGGPVLASDMSLSPVSRIFTRIGARDATQKGQSTLFVELSETAEILRSANGSSLCLIDELGRGTSTHDGLAIAHASLQFLKEAAPPPPLTIFSTHYHSLALEQVRRSCGGEGRANDNVQLGYMDFALTGDSHSDGEVLFKPDNEEEEGGGGGTGEQHTRRWSPAPKMTFLYRLVPGICDRSFGVEVALMAGVRPALVETARVKSAELATQTALHEDMETIQGFLRKSRRGGSENEGSTHRP